MKALRRYWAALFALTGLVTAMACMPTETVRISPSPSAAAPTTARATATVRPSATATPSASPSASPSATVRPSASPGGTPSAACPPLTGGSKTNLVLLTAMRVAHNPGFDRLVFEFSPTDQGSGGYGIPAYEIGPASSFIAVSGQPIRVAGNAFFNVRFAFGTTNAHSKEGKPTLTSSDLVPTTPLVKQVKVYEDFEATVQTAVGLDHLVCPTVLTLTNPVRLVLDFATPP